MVTVVEDEEIFKGLKSTITPDSDNYLRTLSRELVLEQLTEDYNNRNDADEKKREGWVD